MTSLIHIIHLQYGDREARDLWHQLLPKIPQLFEGLEILPALVHGDLWGGNVGETDSEPGKKIYLKIIFLPNNFY